jgi:AcrR family transcriptional regulator
MSADKPDTASVRRRDSAATRQALLDAARELFGAHGFDQTTLRDVGERAGVDASLIARYFGNKVALYLAAMAADAPPLFDASGPLSVEAFVRSSLGRADVVGVGPITRAILQPEVDEEIRTASLEYLQRRILLPLTDGLRTAGIEQPELRAEIVVAAMMGILAVRSGSSLPELAAMPRDELAPLIAELLDRLLESR